MMEHERSVSDFQIGETVVIRVADDEGFGFTDRSGTVTRLNYPSDGMIEVTLTERLFASPDVLRKPGEPVRRRR
jgi:hypothetical protein